MKVTNVLLFLTAVALTCSLADAMATHRRAASGVHSYYYFPNPCAAVAAANFVACGHPVPNGFEGALHQGDAFVGYGGCPHSHYVVGVGQVHGVRFRRGKDEDEHGPTKGLRLEEISCDGKDVVKVTQNKDNSFEFDAGKCTEKQVKDVLGKIATVQSASGSKYKVKVNE